MSVHVMVSFKDVYQEPILTPLDTVLTGTVTICNYNDILWSEGRGYNLASLSITLVAEKQICSKLQSLSVRPSGENLI